MEGVTAAAVRRQRAIQTALLLIILATLPCYCVGFVLLGVAPQRNLRTTPVTTGTTTITGTGTTATLFPSITPFPTIDNGSLATLRPTPSQIRIFPTFTPSWTPIPVLPTFTFTQVPPSATPIIIIPPTSTPITPTSTPITPTSTPITPTLTETPTETPTPTYTETPTETAIVITP